MGNIGEYYSFEGYVPVDLGGTPNEYDTAPYPVKLLSPPAWVNVTFSGTSGQIKAGDQISITSQVGVGIPGAFGFSFRNDQVAVKVQYAYSNAWSFLTLPGHVIYSSNKNLYPSQIGFGLFDLGDGKLEFLVTVQENIEGSTDRILFTSGLGSSVENGVWNNLQDEIEKNCKK